MALTNKDIEVEGEKFSLLCIPDSSTNLVQRAKEDLLKDVYLEGFVNDLSSLGNISRIAYYGAAENSKLQIAFQNIGYTITRLADKSCTTVHRLKTSSREVLRHLQSSLGNLLDGNEEFAIVSLEKIDDLRDEMAKDCKELHNDYAAAIEEMKNIVKHAQEARGLKREENENLEKERQHLRIKLEVAKRKEENTSEAEKKAKDLYDEAQRRETRAYQQRYSITSYTMDAVCMVIKVGAYWFFSDKTGVKDLPELGNEGLFEQQTASQKDGKMKHQEFMYKMQEARLQASLELTELAERVKNLNCVDGKEDTQLAIEALHMSIGALKQLSTMMMNASYFWAQMSQQCKTLSGEKLKTMINITMAKILWRIRLRNWASPHFKTDAVNYYAKWVAFRDICDGYKLEIKEGRRSLYSFLEENPTVEQSYQILLQLDEELFAGLIQTHEGFVKKYSKVAEEQQ